MAEVETTTVGRVRLIEFNRPDQMNGFTFEMAEGYLDALQAAAEAPEVRAIVVTGRGRGFSAGADRGVLGRIAEEGVSILEQEDPRGHLFAMRVPKPIVAAVNGPCLGLGMVHALACDFRIAATDASFGAVFSRLGLAAEQGISWLLPQIAGRAVALDLLLSGRTIDGPEARELGIVHRLAEPENLVEEAMDFAARLAAKVSPASIAVIKRQVTQDPVTAVPAVYEDAQTRTHAALRGADFAAAITAIASKSAVEFPDLVLDHDGPWTAWAESETQDRRES